MNRTIKDANVKRYFCETHDQLRTHLRDFVDAYNLARKLKTLRGHRHVNELGVGERLNAGHVDFP